jgi:hypothetical protein
MVLVLSGVAQAKLNAEFPSIIRGALSYNATGGNIIEAGNAVYDLFKGPSDEPLGVMSGGVVLQGNFAFYGVCTYDDSEGALAWAMSHPLLPLGLEVRAHGLQFDTDNDQTSNFSDCFTLDISNNVGFPVSFAELADDGYTDLTYGQGNMRVWFDIALGDEQPGLNEGEVAISIIMDGFMYNGDADPMEGKTAFVNAIVVPGDLGCDSFETNLSGIRIVPEPATIAILSLGGLLLRRKK